MCGFANPGSLGIILGGLGTMAPDRRDEIVSLGFRCLVSGTMATLMTGAVVALIAQEAILVPAYQFLLSQPGVGRNNLGVLATRSFPSHLMR